MNTFNDNEILEQNELATNDKYSFLYPNLNDPNFNIKIAQKKEFNDTEYDGKIANVQTEGDRLCNAKFELASHQIFVRNFLSNQTPYNGLLLYHGLGTGKTCSAITISEEFRQYMKQMGITKRIIIVGNKNIQDNYKLQLFDERNLELINGIWKLSGCTGNKFMNEINPMNMKGLSKSKVISQVNNIINLSYLFLGYREFGNLISKKMNKNKNEPNEKIKKKLMIKAIENEFSNRLIIIDEVQNVRMTDNIEDKKVGKRLLDLAKYAENVKLLLLSATPMFNSYREIIWLINLLNENDGRTTINISDIFDSKGNFKVDSEGVDIGKEILIRKARGYISFIRGDNPYTFPYRIYPKQFSPSNSIIGKQYPEKQINGKFIPQGIEFVDVYITDIGKYQKNVYDEISSVIKDKYVNLSEEKLDKGLGYQLLEAPLQILNIAYPNDETNIKEKFGKLGLESVMTYSSKKNDFEYKSNERIFNIENIGNYSGKIKSICDNILVSEGIILIYSQYIDGGIIPIALALEELGFSRYGRDNLFKKNPSEPIDSITLLPKSQVKKENFNQAKYSIISGDVALSPNNIKEVKTLTDNDNKEGKNIKVVIISRAGSEGIDLKNIRQIHVLDPWYNMNRVEQIIGRGVRTCSHKNLEFSKRNVMIFLYATLIDQTVETLDLYLYRLAEIKALKIGQVSRILKKGAIDCILNRNQSQFTVENMNQTVEQYLSNKIKIIWQVGDKPFSALCDYMEKCSFECQPSVNDINVNYDTYNEDFIMLNIDKIVEKIKDLFIEKYLYNKKELIESINSVRNYPLVQIYSALNKMINDESEILTDSLGKKGYLINIGDYYLFQPIEIRDNSISVFERMAPIDYKHKKIVVELPETIDNVIDNSEKDTSIDKIIDKVNSKYLLATQKQTVLRGNKDWYIACYATIERMVAKNIDRDLLEEFLIEHIMESLVIEDKLSILSDITNKKQLNKLENLIQKYLTSKIIKDNDIVGIIFNQEGQLKIYVLEDNKWIKAKPKDIMDLSKKIEDVLEVPSERFAHIIGFISLFKNEEYVFKTLDTVAKSQKGARCDQAGKEGVIKIFNKINKNNNYTKENTKLFNVTQMCCEQELYLRYYNHIRKDGKYWFLTPEQALRSKIDK